MQLTSEEVHWLIGGAIVVASGVALLHESGMSKQGWLRFAIPLLLIVAALMLAFDPLLHGTAAPQNYAQETGQHLLMGIAFLFVAAVETLRALGRLAARGWGLVLPAGLVFAGIMFLRHAQHDTDVPMIVLMAQHRVHGATLLLAGLILAAAEFAVSRRQLLRTAALSLALLFGVQMLLYTEGRFLFGSPSPDHLAHAIHAAPEESGAAQAVESFQAALTGGDAAAASRWLAPDVLIYESGGVESSRAEYAAHHMKGDMAFMRGAQVQQLDRKQTVQGDMAVVTTRSRIVVPSKEKPLDVMSTETMVLKRAADDWQIVHIHWSSRPAARDAH
jgi:ketosteroid isomerase-like protein/uncharacterized membrane protein HdeD (DUF308 family)